jgi:integrase
VKGPGRAIREKVREECGGRKTESYRTLHYRDVPPFVTRLRAVRGTSARALEFALLTAARTAEIRGARWCEIDFESKTWTVPAERMKAREAHTVHLSDRAIEILEGQLGISTKYVFPSVRGEGAPLSNMAMLECLRRLGVGEQATVHGLCRASFATWAYEAAGAREEIVEACLAHKEADRVKAAYDRSQHHTARRWLLQAWSDFVNGKARGSNLVEGDFRAPREHAQFALAPAR